MQLINIKKYLHDKNIFNYNFAFDIIKRQIILISFDNGKE